jgi:Putative lumazine-binding
MTTRLTIKAAATLACAALACTPVTVRAQSDADADAVRATVQAFADGAAKQDVELLERTLHSAAVQFINGKEISSVDRPTYLAAIRAKKLGGLPLTVAIQGVQVENATAQAQATFSAEPFTLSHALSLVKVEGQWWIVSTVVSVIPK